MNELQQIELQILKSFLEVCEKLELKYYLVCGTALGAVKYGGFIPWDDDIDVGLPREDYEIFCSKAQALLPEYYFVQTAETDEKFPFIYCKIRDSRTTYLEKSVSEIDMNHGVYIDVFPLDGYPTEKKDIRKLEKRKKCLKLKLFCAYCNYESYSKKAKLLRFAGRVLGYHKKTKKIIKKINELISKWKIENSQLICNHGNWQGKLEYAPKSQYGNGIFAKFEGLDVIVPENFDEYLTQKYGNWKEELPKEKQKGHHYYEVCDLTKPYTEYVNFKG